jgi:integrase
MSVQSKGRGLNTHLIKITLGYHPVTGKRHCYTETFKGTKREARLRAAELEIQHSRKKLVAPSGVTFRECFNLYLDEARSRLSLSTLYTYESFVERYLLPSLGDKGLRALDKDGFQKVYDSMIASGFSPYTIHTLHDAARRVVMWALERRLLSEDILIGVKLLKIPKVKPEYLTYDEMQAFFDEAPKYWYGNAFKFQFVTGLRNQELMALMWEDINFETGKVHIRRACIWAKQFKGFKGTKNGEEREIVLDPPAINLLKRVKAAQEEHIKSRTSNGLPYGDEHLVFCTKDGRVPNIATVRGCFMLILKRIGITRRFRWYGARHTHATHLLDNQGANPRMIANRMGHSVEMLFRRYGHEMEGQQLEALSKISSRVTL